jgi:hypothetical protein
MDQDNKTSQTSTPSNLRSALEGLGHRLTDNGDSWRTSAIYRGGRNGTSILIYKNSGVWYDYGQGIGPCPYHKLVELTLNTSDPEAIEKFLVEFENKTSAPQNEYIEMSKIYPQSVLDDLLPSYKFYLDKKISEKTLKKYNCGFSGSGKLYRRIVFPIFNEHGQIIGFSGRKIDQDNDAPKWKHLGKRREWVYPFYNRGSTPWESDEEIVLVESIGDSLALTENGIEKHFVLFGLSPSSALIGCLLGLNPKKIIISTNNDSDSDLNRGQVAALKVYLDLSGFFPTDRLEIRPPLANDFGDMHEVGISFDNWRSSTNQASSAVLNGKALLKNNKISFTASQRKKLVALINNG